MISDSNKIFNSSKVSVELLEFAELADEVKLEFPLNPDKVEVDDVSYSYNKRFYALLIRLCNSAYKLFPIFSKIASTKIKYEILIPP